MPSPPLLRALGALGDREAVPVLARCLKEREDLRATALESLGRIGGPEARAVLHRAVLSLGRRRRGARRLQGARGLRRSRDDAFFRAAMAHPDWQVRLAAAEVLAAWPSREQRRPDPARRRPVPAVAHRALAALEA